MEREGGPDIGQDVAALAERLGSLLGGSVSGLRRLTGGASLQSWAFDLDGAGLILRRRAGRARDVIATSLPLASEAALLRAAEAVGVAVPHVVYEAAAGDGLGEAYAVSFVAGETLGKRIVAGPGFARARAGLARQCGAALAAIHRIDPRGLPPLERMDAAATLDRYEAIHRGIGATRPVLEAAFGYFRARLPEPAATVLTHGDFRTGNLMVAGDDAPQPGLAAVLDWELSHLGDAAEDLGWLCVNSWRFGQAHLPVGGFGTLADLLAGYEAAGGAPVAPARVRFWQGVGSLKWAVMCEMMFMAFASGADPSMERATIGRRVSECEADLLALMAQGL